MPKQILLLCVSVYAIVLIQTLFVGALLILLTVRLTSVLPSHVSHESALIHELDFHSIRRRPRTPYCLLR